LKRLRTGRIQTLIAIRRAYRNSLFSRLFVTREDLPSMHVNWICTDAVSGDVFSQF
jgi:hypothetical protein